VRQRNTNSIFDNVDRISVVIYLILILMGWLNIYAAVYNEEHSSIFDMSQKYGKQMIWIGTSLILAFIILIIDVEFYTALAYVIFAILLLANIAVPFLGKEVNGSHSWFKFGESGIQPAEFMKFATSLAIAKFVSVNSIKYEDLKNTLITFLFILIPLLTISVLQNETGLAIVLLTFSIALYREGLSRYYFLLALIGVLYFITTLIICRLAALNSNVQIANIILYVSPIIIGVLIFYFSKKNRKNLFIIFSSLALAFITIAGTKVIYNYLENQEKIETQLLSEIDAQKKINPAFKYNEKTEIGKKLAKARKNLHQKKRIDVLLDGFLGKDNIDNKKEGYNVNQAKIAIGSGGFWGKGYLQGTQTKFNFVPEQETDFIFCTVGEEWGFLGSFVVIALQLTLIIRLIIMAERQRSPFSRIYGYGVASVLFFHVTINIGMTIGLAPVIGIPLPFFSYGGSSLWSFTILLFIFLKLDSQRLLILR